MVSFDRVNHDRLMAKIAERISDKRLLKLIRVFLQAGVMEGGLVNPVDEGTPQGGPLSPLLSNIVLERGLTGSGNGAGSGLRGMRTIVISTFAAGEQGNE